LCCLEESRTSTGPETNVIAAAASTARLRKYARRRSGIAAMPFMPVTLKPYSQMSTGLSSPPACLR
jgi:hypothetical protein